VTPLLVLPLFLCCNYTEHRFHDMVEIPKFQVILFCFISPFYFCKSLGTLMLLSSNVGILVFSFQLNKTVAVDNPCFIC